MRCQVVAFLLFASLAASPFACAQAPILYASSRTVSELDTIHRTVDEVQLRFVVTDKKHQPVTDLQRDQISVFDSGKPAEPIAFRKDTDLPLRVLVLIDGSESVDKALASEQAIAVQLAEHFLRPGLDTARVAAFDGSLEPLVPLTADGGGVKKALSAVHDANLTALYDALVQSSRTFTEKNSGMARRVIILLSDGEDNYSLHGLSDAIEAAQKADATIYAVNVGSSASGGNVMLELADQTGEECSPCRSRSNWKACSPKSSRNCVASTASLFAPVSAMGGSIRCASM